MAKNAYIDQNPQILQILCLCLQQFHEGVVSSQIVAFLQFLRLRGRLTFLQLGGFIFVVRS